jgi:hypothetical protein
LGSAQTSKPGGLIRVGQRKIRFAKSHRIFAKPLKLRIKQMDRADGP